MKAENLIPKVLIACPTSDRHKHLLNEWIDSLNSLTYSNIDICLIDTSEKKDYYNLLKKKKLNGKPIKVLRHEWDVKKWHPVQMLAHAREKIRQYFLKNNTYDYLFWLDDDIFVPKNTIQRLLSHNKDHVGFYVHIFAKPHRKPCILKSGEIIMGKGLNYYSFVEIDAYKKFVKRFRRNELTNGEKHFIPFIIKDVWKPQLLKAYGVNLGCLMVKKKSVETIPFRTHDTFINGEDLWYFAEANDKHFEFWVDTDVRCKHKNTDWDGVIKKSGKKMDFFVVQGPAEAEEAVMIKR